MQRLKEYKKDNFYIFLLFIITIFVFYKIVFFKKIFWGSELVTYYYPYYFYISECIKKGEFPLWSSYIFCGHPVFAVGNTGVLYPFNLPFFFFPSPFLFSLIVVFHFFLAGIFMYILCRVLGLDYFSSFLSSVIFMFCRFFFFYLHAPSYMHSTLWLPLVLLFLEIAWKRKKIAFVFFAIVFLSIQFFGGDASLNLICLVFLFFYFLFRFFTTSEKIKLTFLYSFLILGYIGFISVQLFPIYELNKFSFRSFADFKEMTEGSLMARTLLTYIFSPVFFTEQIEKYKLLSYIDKKFTLFIVFSTFLFFLSFFKKDKFSKLLIFLSILSLIFILGENTFFYKIIWHIPFYKFIRYPFKFIYIYFFTFSLLCGFSLNYILRLGKDFKEGKKMIKFYYIILFFYLVIFGLSGYLTYSEREYFDNFVYYLFKEGYLVFIFILLSFILLILHLKCKISQKNFKYLILGIFIFSLFFSPVSRIPEYDGRYFFPESDISEELSFADSDIIKEEEPSFISFLKKDKELYRIYPWQKYLFLSNIFSFYKIQSMFGYSAQEIKDYKDFLNILKENDLFGLLGVKYILLPKHIILDSPDWKLAFDGEVKIYQNKKFLPRAFFVSGSKVIKREDILSEMRDTNFNPLEYVILEEEPKLQITNYKLQIPQKTEVKILKYTSSEVIISANLEEDGFLFLSDTYYPGWKVYVNEKEDKIYRANYLFRAIYLKKGENKVKFLYDPLSFKIGISLSSFTALVLVFIILRLRKHRKTV